MRAREMSDEEVGVLGWEMETLRSYFGRIGVEWTLMEKMARHEVIEGR